MIQKITVKFLGIICEFLLNFINICGIVNSVSVYKTEWRFYVNYHRNRTSGCIEQNGIEPHLPESGRQHHKSSGGIRYKNYEFKKKLLFQKTETGKEHWCSKHNTGQIMTQFINILKINWRKHKQ